MHRGLSVHSVIVTEGGQVQLVDFRFARKVRWHHWLGHVDNTAMQRSIM
jgi:hypothetical protein